MSFPIISTNVGEHTLFLSIPVFLANLSNSGWDNVEFGTMRSEG